MKLTDDKRAEMFEAARSLSPRLGDLFQNPMEITPEDLNEEIASYYLLREAEMNRWEAYKWKLGEMLCFPEKTNGVLT